LAVEGDARTPPEPPEEREGVQIARILVTVPSSACGSLYGEEHPTIA
jgi:hypothetical protein